MTDAYCRSDVGQTSTAPGAELQTPSPSQNVLCAALCAMKEAVAIFDAEDRFVFWNPQYAALHAGGSELRPGTPFRTFLQRGLALGTFPAAVGREEAWLGDHMRLHTGASVQDDCVEVELLGGRWVRIQRAPLPGGGWMSVVSDVTELIERQSDLHDNEQQLQQLFEGASDGMCIVEEQGGRWVYVRANSALAAIHGDIGRALIGRSYQEVLPPEVAERAHARATTCARTKRQLEFEREHEIDGRRRAIRATFTPLIDADGEVRQVLE